MHFSSLYQCVYSISLTDCESWHCAVMVWWHWPRLQARHKADNTAGAFPSSLCASALEVGALSHQANSLMLSEHHFLCTLGFTRNLSSREWTHWCTKIHLFETISKWQFLYRRNIEIKMKQDITDDACIVDFCALKNITMLLPSEKSQMQRISFMVQVWICLVLTV